MTLTKVCLKCRTLKALEEFPIRKDSKDGHRNHCKDCHKAYHKRYNKEYYIGDLSYERARSKKYRNKNLEKERQRSKNYYSTHKIERRQYYDKTFPNISQVKKSYWFKQVYGITLEDRAELIKKQNYKCLSCGDSLKGLDSKMIHIDHDHKTGRIRGILCHHCNLSLGLLKEDLNKINGLANYVKKHCNGLDWKL